MDSTERSYPSLAPRLPWAGVREHRVAPSSQRPRKPPYRQDSFGVPRSPGLLGLLLLLGVMAGQGLCEDQSYSSLFTPAGERCRGGRERRLQQGWGRCCAGPWALHTGITVSVAHTPLTTCAHHTHPPVWSEAGSQTLAFSVSHTRSQSESESLIAVWGRAQRRLLDAE